MRDELLHSRLKTHDWKPMVLHKNLKLLLFAGAAIFLFFFLQPQIPLWSSDEGRFAEIAREMWETKNFVIPHFNYTAFLDKPILAPLFTCLGYALFGVSFLTSRLVPILAALAGLIYTYRFARRTFDEQTAGYTVLLLMTTLGYVLVGRFAVIDMLMTFFLSLALFCLFIAYREKKRGYYLGAYFAMGLGFLTKGLIGIVLPAGIFFIFLVWNRDLKELLKMKILWGMLILAAVVLPWFLLAMKQKHDFFESFIIEQHVHRFATGTFGRKRPVWFFIPILLGLGLPWSFFLPQAITKGLKSDSEFKEKTRFLICWLFGILIFFSIPKSKLPYYILPAMVPAALLTGSFFSRLIQSPSESTARRADLTFKLLAFTSVLGALGLNLYLTFFAHKLEFLALKNFALITSALLTAGFSSAYLMQRARGVRAGVLTLAGTLYGLLLLVFMGMKIISPIQSVHEEALIIQARYQPGDVVSVFASPDRFSDLPFHLKTRVAVAGSDWGTLKDQSALLPEAERQEYFMDHGAFVTLFNSKTRRVFCLMEEDRLQPLIDSGLKNVSILKQGHGKVLISNFSV